MGHASKSIFTAVRIYHLSPSFIQCKAASADTHAGNLGIRTHTIPSPSFLLIRLCTHTHITFTYSSTYCSAYSTNDLFGRVTACSAFTPTLSSRTAVTSDHLSATTRRYRSITLTRTCLSSTAWLDRNTRMRSSPIAVNTALAVSSAMTNSAHFTPTSPLSFSSSDGQYSHAVRASSTSTLKFTLFSDGSMSERGEMGRKGECMGALQPCFRPLYFLSSRQFTTAAAMLRKVSHPLLFQPASPTSTDALMHGW
mmetsp:Transcript_19542/g.50050  ORF Transcript_19542/g.50050 Transcript_19542/m.50050 type:complete len:253 (+) Transcript_19542:121-879(+)